MDEKLIQEKNELNHLIGRGITIALDVVRVEGRLRKRRVAETVEFHIKQPTLTVLDLVSAEQIELAIDEAKMRSDEGISEAKKLVRNHSRRMAKIIAYYVLGQDYLIPTGAGYRYNDKKLREITGLFYHNATPSQLLDYCMVVTTMSNLGDFTNSIRLMSAARTTMPTLVEADSEG